MKNAAHQLATEAAYKAANAQSTRLTSRRNNLFSALLTSENAYATHPQRRQLEAADQAARRAGEKTLACFNAMQAAYDRAPISL